MKSVSFYMVTTLVCLLFLGTAVAGDRKAKPMSGAFDPEQVLANLEQAIRNRDWNRYADFLAADFSFIPFDSVLMEHPPVDWEEWGRAREVAFIRELVNPNRGATLQLLENVLERGLEAKGRSEWDLVYTLNYGGQRYRSRAVFVFERVDNLWYLREWIDTTIEMDKITGKTWSTSGSLRVILSR